MDPAKSTMPDLARSAARLCAGRTPTCGWRGVGLNRRPITSGGQGMRNDGITGSDHRAVFHTPTDASDRIRRCLSPGSISCSVTVCIFLNRQGRAGAGFVGPVIALLSTPPQGGNTVLRG